MVENKTINEMYLHLNNKGGATLDDFEKFYQLYESISPEVRQQERSDSSKLLFFILKKIGSEDIDENTKQKLISIVEQIAVTHDVVNDDELQSSSECGEYVFIKFLNALKKKTDNIRELIEVYEQLASDLDNVDWVFSLKNARNEAIFPLNSLMGTIVNNFKFDTDNLISLSLLLRLYIRTDTISDEIEEQVEGLINNYNLKCLDYIKQRGKQLLSPKNILHNQIMIFKLNKKVLIRHPDKNYFRDIEETEIKEEKDNKEEIIAYFYEYELDDDNTMNFIEFCQKTDSNKNKLRFIETILCGESFNIFYDDAIVAAGNQTYSLLNPFGKIDKKIIYQKDTFQNDFKGFLEVINIKDISLRQSIIYRRDRFDILTLDFLCKFLSLFIKSSDRTRFLQSEIEFLSDDFIQNTYFQKFFEFYYKNGYYPLEVIEVYVDFLKKHIVDYNRKTEMSTSMSLIMPYKIFLPDRVANPISLYKMYFDVKSPDNQLSVEEFSKSTNEDGDTIVKIVNQIVEGLYDSENNEVELKPGDTHLGLYDKYVNKIYYNSDVSKVVKKVNKISNSIQSMQTSYQIMEKVNWSRVEEVIKIIQSVKLLPINFQVFSVAEDLSSELTLSIFWYKLLWHFKLWNWDDVKISKFLDLILEMHFIQPAINYRTVVSKWCEKISGLITDKSNLVFQKENNIGTTLNGYISEYTLARGGKQVIDKSKLDTRYIEISNGKLLYNGCEINKIIILVDNIMGGTSLSDALNYYFGYIDARDEKGRYFATDDRIRGDNFKNLNIPIEVHPIWSPQEIVDKFKNFEFDTLEDDKVEFEISIISNEAIDKKFQFNDDIKNLVNELYLNKGRNARYLLLRFNNMPHQSVFPTDVTDTKLLVGLFNRSKEIDKLLE